MGTRILFLHNLVAGGESSQEFIISLDPNHVDCLILHASPGNHASYSITGENTVAGKLHTQLAASARGLVFSSNQVHAKAVPF